MNSHKFNEDYYENGVKTGISGYENFHWIPQRSYSEAVTILEKFDFETCIDYGCAKGFLVHAINKLGKDCKGVDISEYAINNCHPDVKNRVFVLKESLEKMNLKADLIIAKDVLEHIEENKIPLVLEDFKNSCKTLLLVIPLGDNDLFRIREYEIDKTHITKKDEDWWITQFEKAGLHLVHFNYVFGNIKLKWTTEYPYGNGFFILKSQ